MLLVYKSVFQSKEMMIIILVQLRVEEVENRNLHHALIEICCAIFDNLDCNHFLCLQVLTFHNLTKCPLAEYIQDQISAFFARVFTPQYVVYIENIIAILIIIAIILDTLAWFGQYSSGVS